MDGSYIFETRFGNLFRENNIARFAWSQNTKMTPNAPTVAFPDLGFAPIPARLDFVTPDLTSDPSGAPNGRALLVAGVNRHEHDPLLGKVMTEESMLQVPPPRSSHLFRGFDTKFLIFADAQAHHLSLGNSLFIFVILFLYIHSQKFPRHIFHHAHHRGHYS